MQPLKKSSHWQAVTGFELHLPIPFAWPRDDESGSDDPKAVESWEMENKKNRRQEGITL
jgi:hypothetical protein